MGQVISVVSGKGGTGKTSFCAGVAVALCALGEKVLLIDADSGLRSLDIVLGMSD
ncbi:MAG: AAA family ATPase, partial [Clostridia bacterium]|nr:AAA family ATPase [Clostridia bacterium]